MSVASIDAPLRGPAAFIARLKPWQALGLNVLAGAVAALAYAPFFASALLMVGLCILVWQLDAVFARPGRAFFAAFARGWAFAAGHFGAGVYWVGSAFEQRPGAEALAPVGVLALAMGLALIWGLALALARPLWTRDARRLPIFVLALMLAELTRGHLFGGFPWNLPAYVWPAGGAISQAASVLGAYGLSAVTLLLLVTPAALCDRDQPFVRRAAPVLVAALALGLIWGAGAQRLANAPVAAMATGPIVRVADPGYTQREKWQTNPWVVLDRYLQLSQDPRSARSQIVIWPEGAIPIAPPVFPLVLDNEGALEAIGATLGDRALILGLHRADAAGMYNAAAMIDAVSGVIRPVDQTYDKMRLVPFGEFIPLYDYVSWLGIEAMQQIGNGFVPGAMQRRLIVPDAEPAAVHICYESIYPGFTPRGVDRPGWIINITNDAWFGRGTGPWQHANTARYRSIEEGLPTARAASGGVSGIFDSYGRAIVMTGLDGGAVEAPLPAALPPTPYAQFGEWITLALLLVIAAMRFIASNAGRGLRS
jgi:apolipoprotein N-acyltransferase